MRCGSRFREPIPAAVIAAAGGEDAVSVDDEDRIRHAAGKGYPDLIRMRSGAVESAPDAVLAPPDGEHVAAVLEACAAAGVAVVPFGGGTSVVGGVEPERGSLRAPRRTRSDRPAQRCESTRSR